MTMNTPQRDIFVGWESYPQNLPLSPAEICAKRYGEKLSHAGGRLFVEDDESQAGMLDFGPVRQG